jgi:drug/metabolite transporter (DMT)-like permease
MESVFAVLAGCILLHETMTAREIAGCVLMFAAVIIANVPNRVTT